MIQAWTSASWRVTTVDRRTGVADQVAALLPDVDAGDFASRWRDRLPAWPDSVAGLARLGTRSTTAALSNGGFALLTALVKDARLPFDRVLSAELARTYEPDCAVYLTAAGLSRLAEQLGC
jgi:2-haloacid dehalogenase